MFPCFFSRFLNFPRRHASNKSESGALAQTIVFKLILTKQKKTYWLNLWHISFGFLAPRCLKAREPSYWDAVPHFLWFSSFLTHFLSKTTVGMVRLRRLVFQRQRSGCLATSDHKLLLWGTEDARADLNRLFQLTLKKGRFFGHHRRRHNDTTWKKRSFGSITGTPPPPPWKQKPSSLLIRCRVSRRIFMVNATTH